MASPKTDTRWLRHAFLMPIGENRSGYGSETRRRYATSAAYKFTNTTPGGNFTINNPPQFTRYADIRQPGRGRTIKDRENGMGRYYSEAIDDTKQVVHMAFGVPRYNSWTSYFTNFYDRHSALLANTGRTSGFFYNLGFAGTFVATLPLQPYILGFTVVTKVYNFLMKQSPSKWYYFEPTMHSYWSAVNVMANEFAIGLGIIPRVFAQGQKAMEDPGQSVTQDDLLRFSKMYPDIFREGGGVDVMALANRAQRIADASQEAMERRRENVNNLQAMREQMRQWREHHESDPKPDVDSRTYFENYINATKGGMQRRDNNDAAEADATASGSESDTPDFNYSGINQTNSFSEWSDLEASGIWDFMKASQRDGSQFASFRVNYNGTMSESVNNSVRDSDVAQTLNSKVASGRSAAFNFMGGNITPGADQVIGALQGMVAGALDSVHLGGLATLAGTAFMDIPKIWDGSTVNLPRAEYTVPLPSAYGNKMSRFLNMYIPISMLLAGALPLAAGRAAYTSPFLCQIYHQGRVQCQLGMIDSMTITRGTGNVGWSADNDMLGAEISFSVVDMSSIMAAPIKGAFASPNWGERAFQAAAMTAGEAANGDVGAATAAALTGAGGVWDEQSQFQDYMAVLSGLPVSDSYYVGRRLNLNMTRAVANFRTWRSPSNFMAYMLDSGPARAISAFAQTTDRF